MELKYFHLIDGSILTGMVLEEDDQYITLRNAVELGRTAEETDFHIEQRYFFKGMYCPFVETKPIITRIPKTRLIAEHKTLEKGFTKAYNKFIVEWFRQRVEWRRLPKKEELEQLEAAIERMALANTQIH